MTAESIVIRPKLAKILNAAAKKDILMIWENWLVIIPARLQSTRLPEKPLADLAGKPLIVRVYERILPLRQLGAQIVVATDSLRIAEVCQSQQIPVEMTSESHQSGTDRCAEVARKFKAPYILNVQGDEPFVDISDLQTLAAQMVANSGQMGTMKHWNSGASAFHDPNCVKVVVDAADRALYFSRASIPYYRDQNAFAGFWQHVGVYAFAAQTLEKFCTLPRHDLEKFENLEQLRALAFGIPIIVTTTQNPAIGIDTSLDLEAAIAKFT